MLEFEKWVRCLDLEKHPEGGYYREVYRSSALLDVGSLPSMFTGTRSTSTSIYYLLTSGDKSCFHRLKSDELWYFHAGQPLDIFILANNSLTTIRLGLDVENGECLQCTIPANTWFGAKVVNGGGYSLCSCNVAPGFDFADFEMADRALLSKQFPAFIQDIEMLTNG